MKTGSPDWTKPFRSAVPPQRSWKALQKQARSRPQLQTGPPSAVPTARLPASQSRQPSHGKKILLALLAILAIPLLFLVMLPTLIFGGTAQNAGDTTILNNQAAITENMNEIAFAVSDLLGSGITDARAADRGRFCCVQRQSV